MTEILLVRHGQTRGNAAGRLQGWSDPPLSAVGEAQAHALADRLGNEERQIEVVYTSPLRRAFQTAQVLAQKFGLEAQTVDQLKEIHFGELEGGTIEQLEDEFPDLYARWKDKTGLEFRWPGGERRGDFFRRVAEACERIKSRHREGKIIIVAHGGAIRACLAYLLPDQLGEWWTYQLTNAGLTHVRLTGHGGELIFLDDTAHLGDQDWLY